MTLEDMIYAVRQGTQNMDAFTANLHLDEQIVEIINDKINTFVRQEYFKNKVQLPDGTLEITKEALYNLQTLILTETEIIGSVEDSVINLAIGNNLTQPVMFIVSLDASINELPLDAPVRIVTHDKLNELLRNPFRTTSILSPLASMQNDKITVYVKKRFLLNSLKITFIKVPLYFNTLNLQPELTNSSDLPEHTHQTIVDMVVQSILEKNESPRYQQNVNENILNK